MFGRIPVDTLSHRARTWPRIIAGPWIVVGRWPIRRDADARALSRLRREFRCCCIACFATRNECSTDDRVETGEQTDGGNGNERKRLHGGTLSHPQRNVNRLSVGRWSAYGAQMERNEEKQRAALADLARLRRQRDALGGLFGRAGAHFGAADTPAGDAIELWGRRIGRGLSAIAFLALAAYLYLTYVR